MATKLGLVDSNIRDYNSVITPMRLKSELPLTEAAQRTVLEGREAIRRILRGDDDRILLIDGPCSSWRMDEHIDFSSRASQLAKELGDAFLFVQRVYLEKPRTTVGWTGVNGEEEVRLARQMLLHNANIGLLSATEFLNPIVPQYYDDLTAWIAVGARNVESQPDRQRASGTSTPVGFKNNTSGNVKVAIDAVVAARSEHSFWGVTEEYREKDGQREEEFVFVPAIVNTLGNQYTHIVLRGGESGPNYDAESVRKAQEMLVARGLAPNLVIDCSHDNTKDSSGVKDFTRMPEIFEDVIRQRLNGNRGIVGIMLESNINEGRQDIPDDLKDLSQIKYGVSRTDACISWDTTETIFRDAAKALRR